MPPCFGSRAVQLSWATCTSPPATTWPPPSRYIKPVIEDGGAQCPPYPMEHHLSNTMTPKNSKQQELSTGATLLPAFAATPRRHTTTTGCCCNELDEANIVSPTLPLLCSCPWPMILERFQPSPSLRPHQLGNTGSTTLLSNFMYIKAITLLAAPCLSTIKCTLNFTEL